MACRVREPVYLGAVGNSIPVGVAGRLCVRRCSISNPTYGESHVIDAFMDATVAGAVYAVRFMREPADWGDCIAVVVSVCVIAAYIGGMW
jgi:hypothetical protein